MKRIFLAASVVVVLGAFAGAARADSPPVPAPAAHADHADHADPAARKACTDAMNADPGFANAIVATANEELATKIQNYDIKFSTLQEDAAAKVGMNERHVLYAYVAMWTAAVVFLVLMWQRQRALKSQIAQLSTDLERALADEQAKDAAKTP